jgi:exosortase/archaeosortase family protein
MQARTAFLLALAVCWDAWRLLAGRLDNGASAAPVAALAAALAWRMLRAEHSQPVPRLQLAGLLLLYALSTATGPALLQIGVAVGLVTIVAWHGSGRSLPRLPLLGMALLMLPILPTLDFLLAYPLRRVSGLITVALLRMNGVSVGLEGIALEWHGRLLLFDGACSGVRMLWAGMILASLLSLIGGFSLLRYVRTLALATAIAIAGNGLRAASLFYLENGYAAPLGGPAVHEAVGVAAFLLLGLAIIAAVHRRGGKLA